MASKEEKALNSIAYIDIELGNKDHISLKDTSSYKILQNAINRTEVLEKALNEACYTNAKLANDIVGLKRSDKSIKSSAQSYKEMLLKKYNKGVKNGRD